MSAEFASGADRIPADTALIIEASASPLPIERGAAGRRQMVLPDIEIQATLHVRCGPNSAPASVSLMSADTRVAASELADREVQNLALVLAVPAAQLPPVYTKDFCVESEPGPTTLVKPALVSLQGSLRCSARSGPAPDNPGTENLTNVRPADGFARASAAVDIELRCEPEPAVPLDAGGDGTSSAAVARE